MKTMKITNLEDQGIPLSLRDPSTGGPATKVLPATRHLRKGPKVQWRTEEGVLLVLESELTPYVGMLKGQGSLTVEEYIAPVKKPRHVKPVIPVKQASPGKPLEPKATKPPVVPASEMAASPAVARPVISEEKAPPVVPVSEPEKVSPKAEPEKVVAAPAVEAKVPEPAAKQDKAKKLTVREEG